MTSSGLRLSTYVRFCWPSARIALSRRILNRAVLLIVAVRSGRIIKCTLNETLWAGELRSGSFGIGVVGAGPVAPSCAIAGAVNRISAPSAAAGARRRAEIELINASLGVALLLTVETCTHS